MEDEVELKERHPAGEKECLLPASETSEDTGELPQRYDRKESYGGVQLFVSGPGGYDEEGKLVGDCLGDEQDALIDKTPEATPPSTPVPSPEENVGSSQTMDTLVDSPDMDMDNRDTDTPPLLGLRMGRRKSHSQPNLAMADCQKVAAKMTVDNLIMDAPEESTSTQDLVELTDSKKCLLMGMPPDPPEWVPPKDEKTAAPAKEKSKPPPLEIPKVQCPKKKEEAAKKCAKNREGRQRKRKSLNCDSISADNHLTISRIPGKEAPKRYFKIGQKEGLTKEQERDMRYRQKQLEMSPHRRMMTMSEEKLYDQRQQFVQRKRIKLNVRGMAFETYETTLNRFPKTTLGNPEGRAQYYNPKTGYYDVETSFYSFDAILFYYQSNGIVSCPPGYNQIKFLQDMEYYNITMPEKPDAEKMLLRQPTEEAKDWKEEVFNIMEYPAYNARSAFIARISFMIILFASGMVCAETLYQEELDKVMIGGKPYNFWTISDVILTTIFLCEYLVRIFMAPSKWDYVTGIFGVFDMLAWLPSIPYDVLKHMDGIPWEVMATIGFLRSMKIIKIVRYSHGTQYLIWTIKVSISYVINFCFIVGCVGLFFSCCIYMAESIPDTNDEMNAFSSAPDTFWFIIVTMTTVGYGDLLVYTALGKFFVFLTLLSGIIIMICLPVPMIFWRFCDIYEEEDEQKKWKKKMQQMKKMSLAEEEQAKLIEVEKIKEAPVLSFQGSIENINEPDQIDQKYSVVKALLQNV